MIQLLLLPTTFPGVPIARSRFPTKPTPAVAPRHDVLPRIPKLQHVPAQIRAAPVTLRGVARFSPRPTERLNHGDVVDQDGQRISIMGVTENVFYWSAASFLLGVTMTNFVTNIGTCIGMYRRRPSKFYLALLGVTICSLLDPLCVYVGAARMDTDGYLWNVAACIVSLFGLGVFGTLNFVRFWRTCGPALPRLTKLLGVATLIHVSWYWIVVIWWAAWLFSRMSWNDMDDLFFAYSLWYVYDSIVNLSVSLAFVLYLRSKLVTHGAPQRPGVQRALRTVQLSLAVECLFLLVSNVMNAVDKTTDPLWGLSYLGGVRVWI
ncbi:hypothetical protein AMAG_20299 [Allomyces macrogynus ATCC 38327]|uniref:G-protein coupled receptors family 1 profile domain-containing protein n=1 Tax=Allomyces macrogynus (strain ATCC 38327) TaxID=578462 RepID=A0A0L0T7T9_ALLM3|nr:hypothetical protein AMAG_20299 [Allomyces macrogynus ATCC 38327]|eukprot:KNE70619.1 hypothetical protein AMAG_20299 [Allomyces macrogynus ATCC 38327]